MSNLQHFRANGKLLLTGEYFVLDGAKALALPTKRGQSLTVEPSSQKGIHWKSIDHQNKIWFEAEFDDQLKIVSSSDKNIAGSLQKILQHCSLSTHDLQFTTVLEFPNDWGLGSSSTLISLLAQYGKSDPYELLAKTFGGSGYDIACATAQGPVTYQLLSNRRMVNPVEFAPAFKEHLYFVHLGRKQDSREGIKHYKELPDDKSAYMEEITDITGKIIHSRELDEFCYHLEVHENILSRLLKMEKVKTLHFPDFPGTIKSLGAWGGDFVLAASDESPELITRYFRQKGFPVILSYDTMII